MKSVAVIGIGKCGNQIAANVERRAGSLIDCVYINSSQQDLIDVVPEGSSSYQRKIGDIEDEGTGGDRKLAKILLQEDLAPILNDNIEMLRDKKYVFIVSSTDGGTGSGLSPLVYGSLTGAKQKYSAKFILTGVLPIIDASPLALRNTLGYLNEIQEAKALKGATYMMYDTSMSNKKSPDDKRQDVNDTIADDIIEFTRINIHKSRFNNIDECDLETLMNVPGRVIIFRAKGITEKQLDDKTIESILINAEKRSLHAEINRDKIIRSLGIITYLSSDVNQHINEGWSELRSYLGQPLSIYSNIAVQEVDNDENNNIIIIATGLSQISDRLDKVNKVIDDNTEAIVESRKVKIDRDRITRIDALDIRSELAEQTSTEDLFADFDDLG